MEEFILRIVQNVVLFACIHKIDSSSRNHRRPVRPLEMTAGRIPRVVSGRPWQLLHGSTVVGEAARCRRCAVTQGGPIAQRRTFAFSAKFLKRVNVTVPPMAESINQGTLVSFSANIGGSVEADEEIATVETDKVDVPINSPEAGVVVEYLVEEGGTVSVGDTVAVIETQDSDFQTETQVKDGQPELSTSLSTDGGSAKQPSANAAAPALYGERVVSDRDLLETINLCFLEIANL